MRNMKLKANGSILTIEIDTKQRLGQSKEGKSEIVATSNGNAVIDVNGQLVRLGLNMFIPNTEQAVVVNKG